VPSGAHLSRCATRGVFEFALFLELRGQLEPRHRAKRKREQADLLVQPSRNYTLAGYGEASASDSNSSSRRFFGSIPNSRTTQI
jgi:hypothetical protein